MQTRSELLRGGVSTRCMLVLTVLLLLCEVAVSRLCNSLINMLDGFHTLFVLMHMALPQITSSSTTRRSSHVSSVPLLSPPHATGYLPTPPSSPLSYSPVEIANKSLPAIQSATCGPSAPSPPLHLPTPNPTPVHTDSSPAAPKQLTPEPTQCTSTESLYSTHHVPPSPDAFPNSATPQQHSSTHVPLSHPSLLTPLTQKCGLSYSSQRIQIVGALISALLLASLCISVCLEILSHVLQPHPVQRPLLVTVVGMVSLFHNLLMLWLRWSQVLDSRTGPFRYRKTRSHLEENGTVKVKEQTKDNTQEGCDADTNSPPATADGSLQGGMLVLCNPTTSSVLDPDGGSELKIQNPQPSPVGVRFQPTDTKGFPSKPCCSAHSLIVKVDQHPHSNKGCEKPNSLPDREACGWNSHPEGPFTEVSKASPCMGHLDNQNATITLPDLTSDQRIESSMPRTKKLGCLLSVIPVTQALLCSVLALTNGLVLLFVGAECLHSTGSCSILVYLDPGFSMVAVIVLMAKALPQVYRYGMLLLQAIPVHICVSDLGRRIASVPGVQGVHDLHIWQLTEKYMVASVHVHCHAGFQKHKCGDLMSEVTKVLQSVGVNCCTVQPEFLPSPSTTNGNSPPVIHREMPSLPSVLPCSLACGKSCDGKMCCTLSFPEIKGSLAPSGGETEEEPQMLVIENTFL